MKHIYNCLVFIFIFLLIFGVTSCSFTNKFEVQKEEVLQIANENAYSIEFIDEKNFYIEKDLARYYYSLNNSSIPFEKCDIHVQEPGVEVKEGTVTVTLEKFEKDDDKVRVGLDDSRVIVTDDGKEIRHYSGTFYIIGKNFDRDSLVISGWIDGEQKTLEAYNAVMNYLSAEDLKSYYDQAISLENQLNDR